MNNEKAKGEQSNLIESRGRACWLKGYYKAATNSDLIENSVAGESAKGEQSDLIESRDGAWCLKGDYKAVTNLRIV